MTQETTVIPPQRTASDCACPEGQGLRRRTLLKQLAAGSALGTVAALSGGPGAATRYAFAAAGQAYTGDTLVVLSLRGGFDGLNAIVPIGDPAYLGARPTIGIKEGALLPGEGIFGLHPALAPLKPFWDKGTFGAVHAVGQADPTRSHFLATEELERAAPGSALRTGWLDRTLGTRPAGGVFQATQVGSPLVPGTLRGPRPEMSMHTLEEVRLPGDAAERTRWNAALTAMHAGARAELAAPARAALGAVATASAVTAKAYTPANGAAYPKGALGDGLRDVARLIKANVGLQVATLDEGDWDMHAGMGTADEGWLHDHLTELATALAAFATDLGSAMDGVTLITLSEFGRRVGENGSGGVDHGHGNAVLMLGGGVAGGKVHGRWPGLDEDALVDGDLAGTTDYRQIVGEILQRRCGLGSLTPVFPGLTADPLGVVRPRA